MARILVIDDEEPIRRLLRTLFEKDGHEVLEASDGNIGLRLYRDDPADIVITDLIMPEKEGIETIMELRREYPEVKIIAISGGGEVGVAGQYLPLAKAMGVRHIFPKPIELEGLREAVFELLGEEG